MLGLWHALTAFARSFYLGTSEAWGFWSTSILFLLAVLFAASMLNGIVWRLIEARLKPKLRDKENEAALRRVIHDLKAELYDAGVTRTALEAKNAELSRVIEVERSFNRNWNADAGHVAGARR